MKRSVACVRDGSIENIIVTSDDWVASDAYSDRYEAMIDITDMDPCPGVGWLWSNGTFTAPPPPEEPEEEP